MQCVTKFIRQLQIKDGIRLSMYNAMVTIMKEIGLPYMKLVGFDCNEAYSLRDLIHERCFIF